MGKYTKIKADGGPIKEVTINDNGVIKKLRIDTPEYKKYYDSHKLAKADPNTGRYTAAQSLPVVEIKPPWLTYKEEAEKNYPKSKYVQEALPPWAKQAQQNPDLIGGSDLDGYNQRINDIVAEQLLKNDYPTFDKDYDEDRLGTLGKFSPDELNILKNSNLAYKVEPSIWSKFEQGLLSVGNMGSPVDFKNPNLTNEEAIEENTPLNILAPLSVPGKAVQSIYRNGYSLSDALSGKANNAGIVEDFYTDPLNLMGLGLIKGTGKLAGLNKVLKTANKVGDVLTTQTPLKNVYKLNPKAKTTKELFTKGNLKNITPGSNVEFIQRGVADEAAIDDLLNTGIVRNRLSAGLPSKGRWGEKVYWGAEGDVLASNKYNIIAKNSKGLKNRPVGYDDIKDIQVRGENGEYISLPNWKEKINKPNWLKGYKEYTPPVDSKNFNGFNQIIDNFNPRNLKTESGLDFMKKWHSDPEFIKRYENSSGSLGYSPTHFQTDVLDQLENYQPKNYIDLLKDKGVKEYFPTGITSGGVSYGVPESIYVNRPMYAPFNRKGLESVRTHELTHLVDNNGGLLTQKEEADLLKPFGMQNTFDVSQQFKHVKPKTGPRYYMDPTEIHARMNQARFDLGLTPKDQFTEKMFDDISNKNDWYGMGKYVKDKKEFTNLMNKFWAAPLGVGVGAGLLQQQQENKYGGYINNDMNTNYAMGGMIKRKDGSYSKRGLWDNLRKNKGSGKEPTKEMLEQEAKIKAEYMYGGEMPDMYGKGGYIVTRSSDRKGKTHKVTGPDGSVKYFGDSKLGQHPNDPARKKAFYARHEKNLKGNPHFRAFARKTWADGGYMDDPMMGEETMAMGGKMNQAQQLNAGKMRVGSDAPDGSVWKDIGAGAFGVLEGTLDTLSMGATDKLTDAGYKGLQKLGGSGNTRQQDMIRGFGNIGGAVVGAVVNPASTMTAVNQGIKGLGQGVGNINEDTQGIGNAISGLSGLTGLIPSGGGNIGSNGEQEIANTAANMKMAQGGLMHINEGGTHEQNALGGVPIGPNALVEQGETINNDFVFSDRLKPKGSKRTYAQLSKSVDTKYKLRPDDKLSKEAKQMDLDRLAMQQETQKDEMSTKYMQKAMACGGKIMSNGGSFMGPISQSMNVTNGQNTMLANGGLMSNFMEQPSVYQNPANLSNQYKYGGNMYALGGYDDSLPDPKSNQRATNTKLFYPQMNEAYYEPELPPYTQVPLDYSEPTYSSSYDPTIVNRGGLRSLDLPANMQVDNIINKVGEDPTLPQFNNPSLEANFMGQKQGNAFDKYAGTNQNPYPEVGNTGYLTNLAGNLIKAGMVATSKPPIYNPSLKLNRMNANPAERLAMQEGRREIQGTKDIIRNNATSSGQYLTNASLMGSSAANKLAGTIGGIRQNYDTQNVGIGNQEAQLNQQITAANNLAKETFRDNRLNQYNKILDSVIGANQQRFATDVHANNYQNQAIALLKTKDYHMGRKDKNGVFEILDINGNIVGTLDQFGNSKDLLGKPIK